jgi:hypothetical protein
LLCLLAFALALRILVPAGWMPAAEGGLRIVPCIAAPQAQVASDHHSGGHGEAPAPAAKDDGPCSFFGLSAPFAAPADPFAALLMPPLAAAASGIALLSVQIGRGLAAPPPPSTGPPSER